MQRIALVFASQKTHVNPVAMGTVTETLLVTGVGNVAVVDPYSGILI
jgi:hypothetical protein